MFQLFAAPSAMPGLEARIFVAVAFTAAAAYFDVFNKKWVPNYLLYAFLACALGLNLVFFESSIFWQAIAFGAAAFALSYPIYKMGQLGGADVYTYSAIAIAIPFLPQPLLSPAQQVPYPFILSVLAPTGIAFIAHMFLRFLPYIYGELRAGRAKMGVQRLAAPAIISAAFLFFIYALSSLPISLPFSYVAMLGFLFVTLIFFSLFKQEIKDSMVEKIPISRVQPEDVLAIEKMDARTVSRLNLPTLLDERAISAMRKAGMKTAPVYTKMPFFLPYLLFGLVFTVLFGDLMFYLVGSPLAIN